MSEEFARYREGVEKNLAALRVHIARLGVQFDFSAEIELPDPDEPLAELFAYLQIIQGNLRQLHESQSKSIENLDAKVRERTAELESRIQTIRAQSLTILELSTPAIRLWDGILTVPLVGSVDTRRGQQITENLLEAIGKHQAEVAIIDVTGVPVIDSGVAGHLIKAMEAARLLGATVVLAGVSPEHARTLIRVGADLGKVTTRGTLQRALEYALTLTGREVRPKPTKHDRLGGSSPVR